MATIREVAALAGVSTATVSRVFSRPEAVTALTRERVLTAADELSFVPNVTARSLARGRTQNLGFLVPDIRNPVFGPAIETMQHHAREHGYSLFIAASEGRTADELDLVQAIARQVDGLVLITPRMADRDLAALARVTPVVLINRTLDGLPAVLIPSGDGMVQAVDHLADAGHRSITYLGGPDYALTHHCRLAAFLETCARRGVEPRGRGPVAPDVAEGGVDAIIAYNDQVAVGLMKELARRGLYAGRDLSVIGFDDSWLSELTAPALTTVHLPFDTAGLTALRLLFDVLDGATRESGPTVELSTELVVRSSTLAFSRDSPADTDPPRGHRVATNGRMPHL